MKKYINIIFLFLMAVAIVIFSKRDMFVMKQGDTKASLIEKRTIVLDAGHGGFDPGKVGVNGVKEKEINLSIAFKVKKLLEQNDVTVIMTRETDDGLYSQGDRNKKNADLKKRVEIIKESGAQIAVSIHQNSFGQESSKGAQVFYHKSSSDAKILADIIQNQLKKTIDDGNKRVSKSNDSYYMLKKTECPLVIVECGFLSNYTECELLCQEDYQDKMAFAIHLGILQYLNQVE